MIAQIFARFTFLGFQNFETDDVMATILNFSTKHSRGRNYASIVFKIAEKVENSDPVFATKNQQNRLKTFVNMAKINFWWPF